MSIEHSTTRSEFVKGELDDVPVVADFGMSKPQTSNISPAHAPNTDTVLTKQAGSIQREPGTTNKTRPIPVQAAPGSPVPHDPDMDTPSVKVLR